jgi:hypothetical protein
VHYREKIPTASVGMAPKSHISTFSTGRWEAFSRIANIILGTGFQQLGLVGQTISSAMVHDYALRGTFGLDYDVNPCNTVGLFYQTRMDLDFPQAVRIGNYIGLGLTWRYGCCRHTESGMETD